MAGLRSLSLVILAVCGVLAHAEEPAIDLRVTRDPEDSSRLVARWFGGGITDLANYRIVSMNLASGSQEEWIVSSDVTEMVVSVETGASYSVAVEALDSSGSVLASSPPEMIILDDEPPTGDGDSVPTGASGLDAILDACSSQNFPFVFTVRACFRGRRSSAGPPRVGLLLRGEQHRAGGSFLGRAPGRGRGHPASRYRLPD